MTARLRTLAVIAAAFVFAAALVVFASLPTGATTPEGVVPETSRLVSSRVVGEARALLASEAGVLRLHVAYRGPKRWLGVGLRPAPAGAAAAWAATPGEGGVPALSAVYGRVTGTAVRVDWSDGQSSTGPTESDGAYLVARPGRVPAVKVVALDENGAVIAEVPGL